LKRRTKKCFYDFYVIQNENMFVQEYYTICFKNLCFGCICIFSCKEKYAFWKTSVLTRSRSAYGPVLAGCICPDASLQPEACQGGSDQRPNSHQALLAVQVRIYTGYCCSTVAVVRCCSTASAVLLHTLA
jgi:hypothetical protein